MTVKNNSENSSSAGIIILRWIAFLPVALLAYFIANFGWRFMNILFSDNSLFDRIINTYITPLICYGAGSYAYLMIGVAIAPAYKKIVRIFLCLVFLGILGLIGWTIIRDGLK